MPVKYFQTEHGEGTVSFMQAPRYNTYEEAEAEALKTRVLGPFTTVRIYKQTIEPVASITAKVERQVVRHDEGK